MAIPIIVIILVVFCIIVVSMYNNLVSLRQRVQNAWSQIDVQLKRRFDLIPNLQETVKGYMAHESETFSKIAELRTAWASSNTVAEKAEISMYNTKLEMFPSNLIAKAFNFKASELFEVKDEQEKQNVKIDFSK